MPDGFFENYKCSHANPFLEKKIPPVPSHWFVRWRGNKPAIMSQWNSSTQSNIPAYTSLLPSSHIAQTPRRPSLLRAMWGCRVFLLPPSSTPPLPHPHTHPSSHPPGTYLSVAFIHNPRDLNLFPPHRPRLFLSLLFLKNFMLSSLSSFFFFFFSSLFCSFFICLFFSLSAFYLFQSTQRFQHPYLQERNGEGGGEERRG